jgi:hypothetical protein
MLTFAVLRAQVSGEIKYKGVVDAAVQIVKRKGLVNGLYAGLSAAYLRQWTYGEPPAWLTAAFTRPVCVRAWWGDMLSAGSSVHSCGHSGGHAQTL